MEQRRSRMGAVRTAFCGGALGLALLAAPALLRAQTATIVGYPVNFDTVNDTGEETHGFEIEADGIQVSDITRIFGGSGPALLHPVLHRARRCRSRAACISAGPARGTPRRSSSRRARRFRTAR